MKIERIIYGMQTSNGKIDCIYSPGAQQLLTPKNINYIRQLKPEDSHKYLWFKTEQTVAYPIITEVADEDPKHGGRTWTQIQAFLVNIHEFLSYYIYQSGNPFQPLIQPVYREFPCFLETLIV